MEEGVKGNIYGRFFNTFMFVLITLNVFLVMIETIPDIPVYLGTYLKWLDHFSVAVFSVEYLIRLWACVEDPAYSSPVFGRLRYMVSLMAIIDLLAITPFYLPQLITTDLRTVRMLRLLKLFLMMKLVRYSGSLQAFSRVFTAKKGELGMIIYLLTFLLVASSTLVYYLEHEAQPEVFTSIPATMWWGVITLTTVGYGDMVPVTIFGKIVGSIVAVLGIGMFALPAGILASGFYDELNHKKKAKQVCPYCGKEFEPQEEKKG